MKPTRKDLIRVLKARELARIDAKIAVLEGQRMPVNAAKMDRSIRDRAIRKFSQTGGPRQLIEALDAGDIHYTIECDGHWPGDRDNFRATVFFKITGNDVISSDIRPTAREVKAVEKLMDHNGKIHGQLQLLRCRRQELEYDNGHKLVDETLSRILVEGDETIQKLLTAIETRLDTVLTAAQVPNG